MRSEFGVKRRNPFIAPIALSTAICASIILGVSKEDADTFMKGVTERFNIGWSGAIAVIDRITPDFQMASETKATESQPAILAMSVSSNCAALFHLVTGSTDLRDVRYFDLAKSFGANAVCVELLPAQDNLPLFNVIDTVTWKPMPIALS